ncbi:MAG: hypothetical protein KJ957_05450 [Candidatus Omnitrophica bacterium]|nr:hypothetical protein [Candidatus Omnitrophota bacterium]
MRIGRVIVGGVVVTVFDAIVGAVTCGGVFNWVYKLEPVNVWKPMEGAPGIGYYIGALLLNILFVAVYAMLQKGIPGKNRLRKGLLFGLCVWAVGILPGMFATYMFMTVAPAVVFYWAILALIQEPLKGLIGAAVYGE